MTAEDASPASPAWTPINDYPGDQLLDLSLPGPVMYWGEIGTEGDTTWSWTICARDGGESWEAAGGIVGSEAAAKFVVENWQPPSLPVSR